MLLDLNSWVQMTFSHHSLLSSLAFAGVWIETLYSPQEWAS